MPRGPVPTCGDNTQLLLRRDGLPTLSVEPDTRLPKQRIGRALQRPDHRPSLDQPAVTPKALSANKRIWLRAGFYA